MSEMIRGSCLCGGVRFEVEPPFIRANHCHCDRCRKHSGTAVCTQVRVLRDQIPCWLARLIPRLREGRGGGEGFLHQVRLEFVWRRMAGWSASLQPMGAPDDDPGWFGRCLCGGRLVDRLFPRTIATAIAVASIRGPLFARRSCGGSTVGISVWGVAFVCAELVWRGHVAVPFAWALRR